MLRLGMGARRAHPDAMDTRVFAQVPSGQLDLAALLQNARRFFEATIEVLAEDGLVPGAPTRADSGTPPWVRVRVASERRGFAAAFRIVCRSATHEDWQAARRAEENGRAMGMAELAARCPAVWQIEAEKPESLPALLNLCAILASVALGPVLPVDESTLFGIRGAMERLEAISARPSKSAP